MPVRGDADEEHARKKNAHIGYGDGKLRVNGGPGSTQKSVGEAKADEGQVNDYQQ